MTQRGHKRGFTVVELMIVIAVIAVLATLLSSMFVGAQAQARDTKLQDYADKITDAIQLFVSNKGHFPRGGWGSATAIGAGTECADGSSGYFSTYYTCTVADTLIASGYLPAGYANDAPSNLFDSTQPNKKSLAVYALSTTKAMVFYSMERPSAGDTSHFNSELTECGLTPTGTVYQRDSLGMKNGNCFDY